MSDSNGAAEMTTEEQIESVASSVDEKLAEMREREYADLIPENEESAAAEEESSDDDEGAEETEEETGEEAGDDTGEESSEDSDADDTEQPQDSAGPTLPSAHVRSLKAYGWEDGDIERAYKADPANFTLTAQKIHDNRTSEIAKWAEIGRKQRDSGEQTAQTQPSSGSQKPAENSQGAESLKPVDVDEMVERFGNKDMVEEIAKPVNEAIERVNQMLPHIQQGVDSVQQARQEALSRQIDSFFSGSEISTYAEVYGDSQSGLTDEQAQNRDRVLELADALVAGASMQGRSLSVDEALTLAHDSVSGDFKTTAARKEFKKSVKKRAKGKTQKPSASRARNDDQPKTEREVELATERRLRDLRS